MSFFVCWEYRQRNGKCNAEHHIKINALLQYKTMSFIRDSLIHIDIHDHSVEWTSYVIQFFFIFIYFTSISLLFNKSCNTTQQTTFRIRKIDIIRASKLILCMHLYTIFVFEFCENSKDKSHERTWNCIHTFQVIFLSNWKDRKMRK